MKELLQQQELIQITASNACFDAQNKAKSLVYLLVTNSEIVNKTL